MSIHSLCNLRVNSCSIILEYLYLYQTTSNLLTVIIARILVISIKDSVFEFLPPPP